MTADQAAAVDPAGAGEGKAEGGTNVCVAVHVRPLIDIETAEGCQETLFTTPGQPQVSTPTNHSFTFDHVFGPSATPCTKLYDNCVQPLVEGLFKGYNATVLAYGQTGSGKTYTMGSAFTPGGNPQGVIPKVMQSLYTRINAEKDSADFTVRVGFVEIHKEEIRDLLWKESGPRPNVTVREQAGGGVCLAGAQEQEVGSYVQMAQVLEMGSLCRATASTHMNAQSSRSHAIFTITLEQRKKPAGRAPSPKAGDVSDETDGEEQEPEEEVAEDEYLCAKMHLVDLAGSERAKRTKAVGQRLQEGIHINKGLLALGNVISALCDMNRTSGGSHVPYRDSKLTRLLQDSLGGNSRTCMLACVSPADVNLEETLNTLKYAARARNIRNTPVVNRDAGSAQVSHLRQQLAAARAEVACLKKELHEGGRSLRYSGEDSLLQAAITELEDRCGDQEKELERLKIDNESLHKEARDNRSAMLEAKTERDMLQHHLVKAKEAGFVEGDMDGMLDKSMMETYVNKIAKLESENRRLKQMQHLSSTFFTARRQSGAGMSPGGAHTPGGPPLSPFAGPGTIDSDGFPITPSGITDEDDLEEHARNHEHDRLGMELHKLQSALEDKEKALRELQERGKVSALKEHYDRVLKEANAECESLSKERSQLKQKLQAIAASDKDTKKRLEEKYRSRIRDLEGKMKTASKRAAEASRFEKLKSRTDETCKRLQDEILRMKQQKVALAKAVEQSHKEMNEYKKRKDKELAQAKRAGMKSAAEVQKLAALQEKQQQVLKRKTEEAEAARRRLREMSGKNVARAERAANHAKRDVKSEKERSEWVEKELELCNQVLDMQRVLDGEMAQRGECARQLMEVRRQVAAVQNPELMSPGMSCYSPGKTAATRERLAKEDQRLAETIAAHSERIAHLQEAIMKARAEEEQVGSGPSRKVQDEKDLRRWEVVRTLPDSKLMLRTLFRSAATARSLACEADSAYAEARDELELMHLKYQQADYEARMAKRSAAAAEAAAAAALAAKAEAEEQLASAEAARDGDDGDVETLLKELDSVRDEFCGRGAEAAAAPVEAGSLTPDFSGVSASVHAAAGHTTARYSSPEDTPATEYDMSESEDDDEYEEEDDGEEVEDEESDPTWKVELATPVVKLSRRNSGRRSGGRPAGSHWRHPAAGHDVEPDHADNEGLVLEVINREREENGLDPAARLTVQLMKDFLSGKSFRGKLWRGHKKNRAGLLQDCELFLDMIGTEDEGEESDVNGGASQEAATPKATLAAVGSRRNSSSTTAAGPTPSTVNAQESTARYLRMATDARKRAAELKDHMERRESAGGSGQRRVSDASSGDNLVMASLNLEAAMHQTEGEVTSRPLVKPKSPPRAMDGALTELTGNVPPATRTAAPKMRRLLSLPAHVLPAQDPNF